MATILLPAVRRDTANLFHYATAGSVVSTVTSNSFGITVSVEASRIKIADVGLSVGEVVSARGQIKNDGEGDTSRMEIRAYDAADVQISAKVSPTAHHADWADITVENFAIPAGTSYLVLRITRVAGAERASLRNGMINRGPTAQPYDIPKRGAWAPMTHGQLVRDNEQFVQRYLSGASQITTFPSRRWLLQFATHILEGDELREWSLALDRLSDLTNVFHFVPPEYTGPSTGYEGPLPVVNGAGQLGTSLDCNGVTPEADIVGPGDYVSFPVTTSAGETNYELHRISSLCTSDESGEVTLEFTRPIRLAPANDAVVQIYSPIGQFRLAVPRAGQDIQLLRRASIAVEAEEAIYL